MECFQCCSRFFFARHLHQGCLCGLLRVWILQKSEPHNLTVLLEDRLHQEVGEADRPSLDIEVGIRLCIGSFTLHLRKSHRDRSTTFCRACVVQLVDSSLSLFWRRHLHEPSAIRRLHGERIKSERKDFAPLHFTNTCEASLQLLFRGRTMKAFDMTMICYCLPCFLLERHRDLAEALLVDLSIEHLFCFYCFFDGAHTD
mmetsp:Transcript_59908/g.93107  ORF Transcript_59908/g.93107 Transcript_59908/m.93107 type:complete len:200 (+) Transcript_59908:451-1050(+)